VQRPGADIGASTLSDAVAGHPGAGGHTSDAGAMLDMTALAAYRRRLSELDEDIAEAGSWADSRRLEGLQRERDALLAEVRSATGLGGRQRRSGGTDERARVAVRKAIASAVARIERDLPDLGRLLRHTVRTGGACRYEPDPSRPVSWVVRAPD
jgi:hypothetical protein